ncbi:YjbH domain-containing protein [Gammaproteobacteria bacterium]|nr:YjbH domain-containing protein [Gammaproteobacteria bacterium]
MKRLVLLVATLMSTVLPSAQKDYKYGYTHNMYGHFGGVGYLSLPSAYLDEAGSLAFTVSDGSLFRYGSMTATPFSWLEASYFYISIQDTPYSTNNSYLDKGFNAKVQILKETNYLPNVSIGLIDLAGTGIASSEYIAFSKELNALKFTLGLATGRMAEKNSRSLRNPLGKAFPSYKTRNRNASITGGQFDVKSYFSGPVTPFLGFELSNPYIKNLRLIGEYNPSNYTKTFRHGFARNLEFREKTNNFNIGLSYSFSKYFDIKISHERNSDTVLNFSLHPNYSKPLFKKSKIKPLPVERTENGFYEDLLLNYNQNQLYVQSANYSDEDSVLTISISQNKYNSLITASKEAVLIAKDFKYDGIQSYKFNYINGPFNEASITYDNRDINNFLNLGTPGAVLSEATIISNVVSENPAFQPKVMYPNYGFSIYPALKHHVGTPEQFYHGRLFIGTTLAIDFNKNINLALVTNHSIVDSFDSLNRSPGSKLPNVRTRIKDYLQGSRNYIAKLQLDYKKQILSDHFFRVSGGILEEMYSGVGMEYLYKPFFNNYAVGFESHYVKQRDFDMMFDNRDYSVHTSHANFYYHELRSGIMTHISYGKYLAKDIGYTVDFSKRFTNGFTLGAWFTRTNVSAELFGEGSFDKGIYFKIPLDALLNYSTTGAIDFKLRPLTRDGGQKLLDSSNLIGYIGNHSAARLHQEFSSYEL